MSRDRIITQPLGDPVGSIYEIGGKCYIKTSDASGTMNDLVRKSDGECATDASSELTKCETGAGARQATISTGGGAICRGDTRSVDNIDYIPYQTYAGWPRKDSWMLNLSAPGGTEGPRGLGIDNLAIPYQNEHTSMGKRGQGGTWTTPSPLAGVGDYYMGMQICKILHGGYIRFSPSSVVRGFDEILYWGRGQWPLFRSYSPYRISVQHAETDEWHVVKTWTSGYFRYWLGYMYGYTQAQIDRINIYAYSLGGILHPYVHLTPKNDNPTFQVDPKFHNMPIKSIEVHITTGTMFVWSMWMYALQLYKNGEKINIMDNSILLRSTPAKGGGALY